ITDSNNMGAAMATAAVDTILSYFDGNADKPEDFDIISTGDLGREGYEVACELFKKNNFDLKGKFTDCGMLMYDLEKQDVNSGASGCGCAACVCGGLYLDKLKNGVAKKILLVGTGAMLSPKTVLQKLPIPSIAHAVCIERI
ncbi:MAG: stage V sporulation protein AD, partial [Clostridia bacterium]